MKLFTMNEKTLRLYNGGWRAIDREELKLEYGLTTEEADELCEDLKILDSWKRVH